MRSLQVKSEEIVWESHLHLEFGRAWIMLSKSSLTNPGGTGSSSVRKDSHHPMTASLFTSVVGEPIRTVG